MIITFSDKKLEKSVNDDRILWKNFGQLRAKKIRLRLVQLEDSSTLEDLRNLPGNWHELTENRKGQWACDLDQPYRLIFEPCEKPVPTDENGKYIWVEIKCVEVIEIINYHKEN
jgi:toxin HigB-1